MKSSTKDENRRNVSSNKGQSRKIARKLSDNPKLEVEGTIEKSAGKVQKKVGEAKKVLGK